MTARLPCRPTAAAALLLAAASAAASPAEPSPESTDAAVLETIVVTADRLDSFGADWSRPARSATPGCSTRR
jgi:hypothetical protein